MAPRDEQPAASETRVATADDEKARIEFALNQAESHLARTQPSPMTRRLKGQLERFRTAVDSWSTRAPTREELDRLRERVREVLDVARTSSPTVRIKRSA
jgi:hypothetical protein